MTLKSVIFEKNQNTGMNFTVYIRTIISIQLKPVILISSVKLSTVERELSYKHKVI